MNTLTTRFATAAALALAIVPFVAIASQAVAAEAPATRIRVADIDLNSVEGRLVLQTRADGAVRKLCVTRDLASQMACKGAIRAEIAEKASVGGQRRLAAEAQVTLAAN